MDRNINRAGWVQVRYERDGAAMPEPQSLPVSAPEPQLPDSPQPEHDCAGMVLVMSYVKKQRWGELYDAETGLERGTIFPDLDLPFVGEGACPHDE